MAEQSDEQQRTVARETVPIVEERVVVDRRTVEGATVRVTTHPVAEQVSVEEPVTREQVSVERVPVGEVVDEVPPVREEGDLTVVPVVEERIRVVRELVLTEEIHLRRTRSSEVHRERVEVRRTEVEIEDEPAG